MIYKKWNRCLWRGKKGGLKREAAMVRSRKTGSDGCGGVKGVSGEASYCGNDAAKLRVEGVCALQSSVMVGSSCHAMMGSKIVREF